MSGAGLDPSAGLPVADAALEPAWVRHGSARVQQDYQAALGFEQMLVEQLANSLAQPAAGEGEGAGGEESGGTGASPLSSLLPQSLAQGVVSGGGLGLAASLTRELEGVGGAPAAAGTPGGGTAPLTPTAPSAGASGGTAA